MILIDMPIRCEQCNSPKLEAVTRRIPPANSRIPYSKNDPEHMTSTVYHCLNCGFNWPRETDKGG